MWSSTNASRRHSRLRPVKVYSKQPIMQVPGSQSSFKSWEGAVPNL